MIVELTVENLAIIERSQLHFGPGFTVLTGETGAGKSLLIDAIELALGERADTDLVRTGSKSASVNVVLDLSNSPEAKAKCEELGIQLEDSLLYIQREVFAEGRSQCRVGGKQLPVSTLKQLGPYLIDLHGQHDHQSLMDPERHIGYLDQWIGKPVEELLGQVRTHFEAYEEARRKLNALKAGVRDREQRIDMLRFQVNEIESVNPLAGEMEELEAQLVRLKNSEKLAKAAFGSLEMLSDNEDCAVDQLGTALKMLEEALKFDSSLQGSVDNLRQAVLLSEEAVYALRNYSETLDADPAILDEVAARIDSLKRLRRKYGEDEAAILEFLQRSQEELATLDDSEASLETLEAAFAKSKQTLLKTAQQLSELRQKKASEFSKLVLAQLHDLAMARAQLQVVFSQKEPALDGVDSVEFAFSANLGEVPRPLSKIASGGEISRVMLAIKTALAGKAGVPTLIFDEVDTGLGGRAAATVAKKLEELAAHYQVLVISHLPQIASRAVSHFRIEKGEVDGRVSTQVRPLSETERVEEIARMLTGEQLTEAAMENARALLLP